MSRQEPRLLNQLAEAIKNGRSDEVYALLDQGLSVNSKLSKTETPLTLALASSHWQMAEDLLERGAEPDQKVNGYYPCLSWACLFRQESLAEKLLERNAKLPGRDSGSYAPLPLAVRMESTRLVDSLLARGAQVNDGSDPLRAAIELGNQEICQRLITAGARLDSRDYSKNSLLHAASLKGNLPILRLVLDSHPKLSDAVNSQGQSALHYAAQFQSGNTSLIETLVSAGAHVSRRDRLGQTPIVLAAAFNSRSVLEQLLRAKGAIFSEADRTLALKLAIGADRQEQVSRLMADFDLATPLNEQHPLRLAVSLHRWPMVEILLRCGVDAESTIAQSGEPLLTWSIKHFQPELTRILLKAGSSSDREKAVSWLDSLTLMQKTGRVLLGQGSRPESEPLDGRLLVALQKNIEPLGFVLSPALAERVLTLTDDELQAFYDLLVPCLRAMVGADKPFKPMYPNFPRQVKEASDYELQLNALLHYWGDVIGRRITPLFEKLPRPKLTEKPALKPVGLADSDELPKMFRLLLEARGSLTPQDKQNLEWIVFSRRDEIAHHLPQEVPFRENSALLAAALLRFTALHSQAASYLKNGVDVLRTATAYSGGDVSLAENTRFQNFPKSHRRWLLAGLEADPNLEESLWRQPEKFKRLGEKLHPGEYKKRFPNTWEAFRRLRAGTKPVTFGSQVEAHLLKAEIEDCLPLLGSRPGEFARRLDHLLRLGSSEQAEAVAAAFGRVISQVPSPLLLQLRKHFQSRHSEVSLRVVFPKGDLGKLKALANTLPPLDLALCSRLEQLCREALLATYASRPALGTCWLDERLKGYTVPFALRSASKALHTVSRGSRLHYSLEEADSQETLRFFIWWRDGQDRTDIDLSAHVLDGDFQFQTTLAYYNLKELGGYHSGDITSAPDGASEFIDIEVAKFLERDARYVMMVVNSFTTQPYCDLPECFAGFMRREKPNSGEIYEPRTLLNKFDLTANTTIAIPLILDLKTREVIWTDLSLKRNASHANNVHGNRSSLSLLCESMLSLKKPSLYDLFELHIEARGQAVSQREEAQTVFATDAEQHAVTPYHISEILAEYL